MEKKKFDLNSIIGFALIFGIILWMMYNSRESELKEQQEKAKQEKNVIVSHNFIFILNKSTNF